MSSREDEMNIELGSPVIDSNGKQLGDVDGIVVNAGTKRAGAIVVNAGLFGRARHMVEISAVTSSDDAGVHLDASGATTDKESPVFDSEEVAEAQRVEPPITYIAAAGVGGPVYAAGSATPGDYPNDSNFFDVAPIDPPVVEVESNLNENDVILDRKTDVLTSDGETLGRVKGLSLGSMGTVESLTVTEGFLARERANFALADISDFGSHRVRLSLTRAQAEGGRG
jgi:uncharacterized protein YrrD